MVHSSLTRERAFLSAEQVDRWDLVDQSYSTIHHCLPLLTTTGDECHSQILAIDVPFMHRTRSSRFAEKMFVTSARNLLNRPRFEEKEFEPEDCLLRNEEIEKGWEHRRMEVRKWAKWFGLWQDAILNFDGNGDVKISITLQFRLQLIEFCSWPNSHLLEFRSSYNGNQDRSVSMVAWFLQRTWPLFSKLMRRSCPFRSIFIFSAVIPGFTWRRMWRIFFPGTPASSNVGFQVVFSRNWSRVNIAHVRSLSSTNMIWIRLFDSDKHSHSKKRTNEVTKIVISFISVDGQSISTLTDSHSTVSHLFTLTWSRNATLFSSCRELISMRCG